MAITIGMINQKGGCGKTTTSIEFAACFSKMGYKVLLIDMDQQANATEYSGLDDSLAGTYEVLTGACDINSVLQTPTEENDLEFDILAGSSKLSSIDEHFAKDATGFLALRKLIKKINDIYDFVILDTNPGRNLLMNMAYVASDYIVIPADADEGAVKGIRNVIVDLNKYKEDGLSDADILGVIITRAEENTTVHGYEAGQIKEILDVHYPHAFVMSVRKSVAVNEAHIENTSMQKGKHNSTSAIDYRNITNKILEMCVD
jgi:chromosome partitioning protein